MHRFACRLISSALLFASLVTPVYARASAADTTAVHPVTTQAHGSIALASFRIGARLASRIRFPAGVGLGLTVCTAGIVLEIDNYVRSR